MAVAVQTLLAREVSGGLGESSRDATFRARRVRHCESIFHNVSSSCNILLTFYAHHVTNLVIDGSILVGGAVSTLLSLFTFFQRESVLQSLTTDPRIREASRTIFLPVLVTQ